MISETNTDAVIENIDVALHLLCQPLTVLQCRLALGDLSSDPQAMREAIREGLLQCARLNHTVDEMRMMLQEAIENKARINR